MFARCLLILLNMCVAAHCSCGSLIHVSWLHVCNYLSPAMELEAAASAQAEKERTGACPLVIAHLLIHKRAVHIFVFLSVNVVK